MAAFDVLGGGTAGVHVATEVAAGGKTVALVEAGLIGGESAYLACLPSNSLLLSATRGEPWEDAVARRTEVTGGLDDSAPAQRLRRAGVQVIRGTGRITAPGTVAVELLPGGLGGDQGFVPPGGSRALAPDADKPAGPAAAGGSASRVTTLTYSDLVRFCPFRFSALRPRRRSKACPTSRPGPPRRA
jgi:choline dehydrogenase-like flavoprotein